MLIRGVSFVIGFCALVLLAFALTAGHYGRAGKYALFLVACAAANGAVELAIRRRRPAAEPDRRRGRRSARAHRPFVSPRHRQTA
jgi:hypothetical protein